MSSSPMPTAARECGDCQACCEGWLTATILDQELGPGTGCRHRCAQGCGIYASRPDNPCRVFRCGWLRGDANLPADLRPDLSGVIVISDRPWQGWLWLQDHRADVRNACPLQ